jgi:hypothetical protein
MPGSLTLSKYALHAGPDGYLIEVGQFTGLLHGKFTAKRRRTSLAAPCHRCAAWAGDHPPAIVRPVREPPWGWHDA